jgi:hypothetical protein
MWSAGFESLREQCTVCHVIAVVTDLVLCPAKVVAGGMRSACGAQASSHWVSSVVFSLLLMLLVLIT